MYFYFSYMHNMYIPTPKLGHLTNHDQDTIFKADGVLIQGNSGNATLLTFVGDGNVENSWISTLQGVINASSSGERQREGEGGGGGGERASE